MYLLRCWLLLLFISLSYNARAQQDMNLHLNSTFLAGKNILKVKRDFLDPYLWVLTQGNGVYRINSITGTMVDYSSRFSGYSNSTFIDIASDSKDLVFVATNNNVLKYTSSGIKVIDASMGIKGTINSIGFSYTQSIFGQGSGDISKDELMIATTYSLYPYLLIDGTIRHLDISNTNMRLFETTYRSLMFTDVINGATYPDNAKYYNVASFYTISFGYSGYLWLEGNKFGNTLKSAYYGNGGIFNATERLFAYNGSMFWSTENGLFQNSYNGSNSTESPYHHYLDNVNINKITSIFGLINTKSLTQENYLIGTDQGLYFSNSDNKSRDFIFNYSFKHYDALASKVINDICVNATSYASPTCEDGIWVASQDGLYLLKPDYAPYINSNTPLQAIQFEGPDYDKASIEVCANTTVMAIVDNYGYSGNLIQWYKDGIEIPNQSGTELKIEEAGEYHAVLYDPCSPLHFESNHLKVTQAAAPVFTFNYPDVINYCSGSTTSLKTDDKPNYQYRWYKDGILNGHTTPMLDNITEAGKYKVEVSACEGTWVASKEVQLNFIAIPTPVLNADKTAYCDGDQAILSVNVPIDGSKILNWTGYQYTWYKDGNPITGSISSIKVSQPGKYKVVVSGCSGQVSSNELAIDFIKLTKPVLTANKPAYCIGDIAKLSINVNPDPFTIISWLRDGTALPDEQDKTDITTNIPGNYTVTLANSGSCTISSLAYNLSFTPPPTVSIQQIVNTTLCDGESIDLKASYTSGTIRWNTGETADKISVKSSGTYNALVTTAAGCTVESSSVVQFLPRPVFSVPDATLCQFTKENITLTAPTGFVNYEWNSKAGSNIFTTDKLGPVTLTITDSNGCKATQTIIISSHCDDIHVPNAFTPNGDGSNDTWVIAGLEGDPTTTVRVYNRLGSQVFQSVGYNTPWNGTYAGKKIPAGVYYYLINSKGNKQVVSGALTILY